MLEFYEPGAAIIEDSIAKTVGRANKTNKRLVDFMFGVQKAMLEEMIFVSTEFLDRARAETQIFNEFSSKVAASHSVKDLRTMYEECGQHQIDFVRRDSERAFKHGHRMIETAARPQWARWLTTKSGELCEPPRMGVRSADGRALPDAPADYVHH